MTSSQRIQASAAAAAFLVVLVGIFMANFFVMWLGWGIMFIGLEAVSLRDLRKDDTLSEQIWKGTFSKSTAWRVFWKSSVGVLLVWLFGHFVLGIWK